jgi:hypothetical protein
MSAADQIIRNLIDAKRLRDTARELERDAKSMANRLESGNYLSSDKRHLLFVEHDGDTTVEIGDVHG